MSAENIGREYQFTYIEDGGRQKDTNCTKRNKHTKPWTWEEVAGLVDLQLKSSDISLEYV